MKVLNWNIRHGGGIRRRKIVQAIATLDPDVCVLTEFRTSRGAPCLSQLLEDVGYTFALHSSPALRENGVLVVAKTTLAPGPVEAPAIGRPRWLCARAPQLGVVIGAVYLPGHSSGIKPEFWRWLTSAAEQLASVPSILVGDFNTGLHFVDEPGATFHCTESFETLLKAGWRDAFRELHPVGLTPSWWGRKTRSGTRNGFRLDHLFLSPSFAAQTKEARYLTTAGDLTLVSSDSSTNLGPISDHAALLVQLDVP